MTPLAPKTHLILSATLFTTAITVTTMSVYVAAIGSRIPPAVQVVMIMVAGLAVGHLLVLLVETRTVARSNVDMATKAKVTLTITDVERGIEIRGQYDPPRELGKETPAQMLATMAIDHIERQMSAAAFDANAKPIIHREGV